LSASFKVLLIAACLVGLSPTLSSADEEPTYAEVWRSWSARERNCFTDGYWEGWQAALWAVFLADLVEHPDQAKHVARNKRILELKSRFTQVVSQLPELLDHFYSDPANQLIPFHTALELSVARLRGEDIDEQLRTARKNLQMLRDGEVPPYPTDR
jgi:hypothetical protein